MLFAPLKGRDRAKAKAEEQFRSLTPPCYSWLFDIIRGSALCTTEAEIVSLYKALEADPSVEIVRVKNRFDPPLFNGYRDINMVVAVKVGSVSHLCELQIHLAAIKNSDALHKSHTIYEFFRSFFLENGEAVEKRLEMLCKLPVDGANNVEELVDSMLGSDADASLLEGLCELLTSIQESAGVVKVREAILAEKEREYGAESKEMGLALFKLADAVDDLGDAAKTRDLLERALPIYEREHGSDGAEVAGVLHRLGAAYCYLGGNAKSKDFNERSLAIKERVYGRDHAQVALTLTSLGNAYGTLGDNAKKRDLLERALAIKEREYGRDHTEVAITLTNLGNAYISLGDYAKARDIQERALAIKERAYGRDHPNVANTLFNLAMVKGMLGDDCKARELLERVLPIWTRAYGTDHPRTKICQSSLAKLASSYVSSSWF